MDDCSSGATFSVSSFIGQNLKASAYKGYISYGVFKYFNILGTTFYEPSKDNFTNELSLKAKVLEDYFEDGGYILSLELLTKNLVADQHFNFVANSAFVRSGLKFGSFFFTFEPSIIMDSKDHYLEQAFSIGYDYSDSSTVVFEKTISDIDARWKVSMIQHLVSSLDFSMEYFHHIDGHDKFSIGLWYSIR